MTADACDHLNHLLLTNEIISQLNLSGCRIGREGVKNLENGIAAAPALTDLNLSQCEIDDEGLESIANAISLNKTLENVRLAKNNLHERSADYLGSMLMQTESLKSLDLSRNHLAHTIFAETFFHALSKNETLEFLDMSENGLASETAPSLTTCLGKVRKLRELVLTGKKFEKKICISLNFQKPR